MRLSSDAANALMPMHLVVDARARVLQAGPTLRKLRPSDGLIGMELFDLFDFRRPQGLRDLAGLQAAAASPLRMALRDPPHITFRGLALPAGDGGFVLNLGFGISVQEAIRHYGLHAGDFAVTDPTLEMLYLMEAGAAAMAQSRDLNERLQGAKITAERQASTDTLTGLKNRRALEQITTRYREADTAFSLLGVDLDHFKDVNDRLGHAAGDHVLQQAARIMLTQTNPGDTVVRSGGDEFLIILPDLTDPDAATRVAERLIRRLEEPIPFNGAACRISASIGICSTDDHPGWDLDRLLHEVDTALYAAKRSGRGCVRLANTQARGRADPASRAAPLG